MCGEGKAHRPNAPPAFGHDDCGVVRSDNGDGCGGKSDEDDGNENGKDDGDGGDGETVFRVAVKIRTVNRNLHRGPSR